MLKGPFINQMVMAQLAAQADLWEEQADLWEEISGSILIKHTIWKG